MHFTARCDRLAVRCGRWAVQQAIVLAIFFFLLPVCPSAYADPGRPRGPSAVRAEPKTEVILLRGLFNVFSLGMDDLGRKLEARRFTVKVRGHGSWPNLADDIIQRRRAGDAPARLVLIGHSLGANDIISMAAMLAQAGVGVDLLIPVDATAPPPIPGNVRRVVNFFQSSNGFGSVVVAGPYFRGTLVNADAAGNRRDLASNDLGHTTIDKSARIHDEIVRLVAGLSAARPAKPRRRAN